MRQTEQSPFDGYFFQASGQETAKAPIFFHAAKDTFHVHPSLRTQPLPFFGQQVLPGLLAVSPELKTDPHLAIAGRSGALLFQRAVLAAFTLVDPAFGRIPVLGHPVFGPTIAQALSTWTSEPVSLEVIRHVLRLERIGLVALLLFPVKAAEFQIIVYLFPLQVGVVFFTPVGRIPIGLLRQAAQTALDPFQMRDQAIGIPGLLMQAETDHELVFGSQLNVVSRFELA